MCQHYFVFSQNSTLELSQTDEPSSKKKKKHAAENGEAGDTTAETSVLENGDGGKKKKKNKDKNKENEQDEMEITVNTTADTSQVIILHPKMSITDSQRYPCIP